MQEEAAHDAGAVERLDGVFGLNFAGPGEASWVLWIDGWGEAMRTPALKRISQQLDVQWQELIERIIRDGVASGELHCVDPEASAWRLTALLDGLGVQLTVHEGVVTVAECRRWVRELACVELGVPHDAFTTTVRDRAG
jgi:BetI-type transcriptional repressor, C-terminal